MMDFSIILELNNRMKVMFKIVLQDKEAMEFQIEFNKYHLGWVQEILKVLQDSKELTF